MGFGDDLYRVFYQVMGVLAMLYIECFIRYGGFGDALYRVL